MYVVNVWAEVMRPSGTSMGTQGGRDLGKPGPHVPDTFGRNEQCGSKNTTSRPLTKLGKSVKWYTALNPTPKRPVLPTCVFLRLSPIWLIETKSLSVNTESLNTSRDAPWNCFSFSQLTLLAPCVRKSIQNFTTVAPASSCRPSGVEEGNVVRAVRECCQ